MKKLTFLGLLSLATINFLLADEYISDAYLEEVTAQSEIIYESIDSLPIAKTVEEEAREKEQKNKIIIKEEIVISPDIGLIPKSVKESKETEEKKLIKKELAPPIEEKQNIHENDYLNALEQARSERKIIMLNIRSTDCKYCDTMEAETLSQNSVKNALEANFITIHYNQDLESLPLGLQEGMTPNFIFVNTNEDIMNMYPGMRNPEEFKEVLEQILSM